MLEQLANRNVLVKIFSCSVNVKTKDCARSRPFQHKLLHHYHYQSINRQFPNCFQPHYESEAKCKVFVMKISFHSYANKINFHMKSFALSVAFIVRFTATRKWQLELQNLKIMYISTSSSQVQFVWKHSIKVSFYVLKDHQKESCVTSWNLPIRINIKTFIHCRLSSNQHTSVEWIEVCLCECNLRHHLQCTGQPTCKVSILQRAGEFI